MGIHYIDHSPYSVQLQVNRLYPAEKLSEAGIAVVVWAEDALAFEHRVPTCLFNLQLLVSDDDLERAKEVILATSYFEFVPTNPETSENSFVDPDLSLAFPQAIHLHKRKASEDIPDVNRLPYFQRTNLKHIILHRASYWDFRMDDATKVLSPSAELPPTFSKVHFPTVSALLDSLSAVLLTPPDDALNFSRSGHIQVLLAYITEYTLSDKGEYFVKDEKGEPTEELLPSYQKVLEEIDPANRPFLEREFRGLPANDGGESKRKRIEILEKRKTSVA